MSTSAQDILDTILSKLKTLASTETVIGAPVQTGDLTLLPVVKVSVGFAAGSGEGSGDGKSGKGSGGGGGGGGGASVTPVGFIVYNGLDVKFVPVGKGTIDTLIDTVPDILSKFGLNKNKRKNEPSNDNDNAGE